MAEDGEMRLVSGIAGAALLLSTVGSILRNIVVPRGLASKLTRLLWRGLRRTLVLVSRPFGGGYETRDKLLAWLAPTVLVGTLLCWLAGLFVAYGLIMYAVSGLSLPASLREAGSSMFTLGYASGQGRNLTLLDFLAAVTGPVVIALQISYLPSLYNAYNRRETEVTLLQSRAAEPAWGPELLARQALVGTVDQLAGLYQSWERLAADIGESHANYPVLLSFRSPRPYRSWIVSLLAVMDAAAMQLALAPTSAPAAQARLMLRSGFTALRDIAGGPATALQPRPAPGRRGPPHLRRVRRRGGPRRRGRLHHRADRRAVLAALPRLAGQLRADRVRPGPPGRRGTGAVERRPGLGVRAVGAAPARGPPPRVLTR